MANSNRNGSQAKIDALSDAIQAITAGLSLERVLRRLAEISAHLVNARYAALGVPDENGMIESFFTYGMTDKQISQMDHYPLGLGLLGALMHETEPIRLEDMSEDPRSVGFCANHPRMTSFLGAPIISKGKHLGNLYLCDRLDDQPFSEEDERLISLLAGHAAIAIENARLSEQLRKLAIIEERDRIAMELHDGIIQSIYAIGIRLEIARATLDVGPEMDAQIKSVSQDLNRVIEDLRRYIQDLKTGVNYSVELAHQLNEVAEGFRSVSSARLVMDIPPVLTMLSPERLHGIVQIVRETLSNIVRHANATEVYVDAVESADGLTLQIADNGEGFDPASVTLGRGLRNIRQRAERLGGSVEIKSQPGHGTTVTLRLAAE